MNTYTPDELILIQQHETTRLHVHQAVFDEAKLENDTAKAKAVRWQSEAFCNLVSESRITLMKASGAILVIGMSFLLNCILIQELMPDLVPRVERFFGIGSDTANTIATVFLTGILFAILLIIERRCNTSEDQGALRPGLHPAVASPIRSRIRRKTAIKVAYLLILLFAYTKLYHYIAGGVEIERMAQASEAELIAASQNTLVSGPSSEGKLDSKIADSQAASFATYYALEWFLHTVILFVGVGSIAMKNPSLAFQMQSRDLKNFRETNRKFQSANSKLRILCQPLNPDDEVNALRAAILAASQTDVPRSERRPRDLDAA